MPRSSYIRPRAVIRRRRIAVFAAVLLVAASVVGLAFVVTNPHLSPLAPNDGSASASDSALSRQTEAQDNGSLGDQDGYIPDNSSLDLSIDKTKPAIAKLDPALHQAILAAAKDAANDKIYFYVTSGWRSARYQQKLLDDAIKQYGSESEALKWVATPQTSAHVKGKAVDIGPTDADSWLSQHGADYGLCQTYANEMWHYELATTPGGVCPEQLETASG